jgi:Flp pilus assembly protein TadG
VRLYLTRRLEGRLGGDDRGFLTIWLLGLCLLLLVLGGVSLDLWRVFSERQALAGLADSASLAGAGGLDLDAARRGLVQLDPTDAAGRAQAAIAGQADRGSLVISSVKIVVGQNRTEVTVSADGRVHLTLLSLLLGDRPVTLHVSSTAAARSS